MLVVLVAVGCVDDHQVSFLGELVDDNVVDGAALLVAHHAVADLVHGHAGVVVGQQVVDGSQCSGASEQDLTHVRNVEQAALLADCHMLLDDAGSCVLDGQQVASEGDDLAAFFHMNIIEGGLQFHNNSLLF